MIKITLLAVSLFFLACNSVSTEKEYLPPYSVHPTSCYNGYHIRTFNGLVSPEKLYSSKEFIAWRKAPNGARIIDGEVYYFDKFKDEIFYIEDCKGE